MPSYFPSRESALFSSAPPFHSTQVLVARRAPALLSQDALQESKGVSEAAIDTLQREVHTPAPSPVPPRHHSTPTIPP